MLRAGRGQRKPGEKCFVEQVALGQGFQVGVAEAADQLLQSREQPWGVDGGLGLKVGRVDFAGGDRLDPFGNHLDGALEQLGIALHAHVVAIAERLVQRFVGVPKTRADRPGAVGQLDLKVEVPVPIWAQLLARSDKHLVDGVLVPQLVDKLTRHEKPFGAGG